MQPNKQRVIQSECLKIISILVLAIYSTYKAMASAFKVEYFLMTIELVISISIHNLFFKMRYFFTYCETTDLKNTHNILCRNAESGSCMNQENYAQHLRDKT